MVQLKYFGDSRDYFKYDLISSVLLGMGTTNYVFVPMLTDHREDKEGKKLPKQMEGKSALLYSFIRGCHSKDLNHWEKWFCEIGINYKTVQPVNEAIFRDEKRSEYWKAFSKHLQTEDALVFIDPDTGLESGSPSYLRKMGREKYILNEEIALLYKTLDAKSVLMIYQHLPNNKHAHESAVQKKVEQLQANSGGELACAYREDDLAFIFIAKDLNLFRQLYKTLADYHSRSQHPRKTLYPTTSMKV